MKLMKNQGDIYTGFDGSRQIIVAAGATVEVSDGKASQLIADFSKNWELVASNAVAAEKYPYKASLIMLVKDNLTLTRQTIRSVLRHTTPGYQLILIDNGSKAATKQYLRTLLKHPHVRLLTMPTNYGFPKAVNYGIGAAEGEAIVLINNDVVVGEGWLGHLLKPLLDEAVAVVSPMRTVTYDDYVHLLRPQGQPPMCEYKIPYQPGDESELVPLINEKQRALGAGYFQTSDMCAFFCVAISRNALARIGLMDEDFGMGLSEDTYYCDLVRRAGMKILIDTELYVFHHTSKTVAKMWPNRGAEQIEANNVVRKQKLEAGYTDTRHLLQPLGIH